MTFGKAVLGKAILFSHEDLVQVHLMPQSFVTTPPPPPPGHSRELNTNQVLKTVNFPTPGAKLLVKPPVWQGLKTSKSTRSHIYLKP